MNAHPPHLRRRGYFLSEAAETGEAETGEHESPEGLTFRVRIVKSLRTRAAVVGRTVRSHLPHQSDTTDQQRPAGHGVKSATATGTSRP